MPTTIPIACTGGAAGALLKYGAASSSFTSIPEVTKLSGPAIKFDLLDITSHDSVGGFREFLPGLCDGDNVSADLNWMPGNTVHKALRVASYARTLDWFEIVFPDTTDNTVIMEGYVTYISPKADIGAILTAALTIKVTGMPVWS